LSTELQSAAFAAQPLSDDRFLESHVAFETSSDQQAQIRAFLLDHRPAEGASIWSVGCGSGILDAPILSAWAGRGHRYLGLEPNALQCDALREALDGVDVEAEVVASTLEDFRGEGRFDLVWLVHTHYYFRDVPEGLAQVARRLTPDGKLVLVAAPLEALNRLAGLFWQAEAEELWFSEAVRSHLEARGVDHVAHRIDGRLDVTACLDGRSEGDAIRDFVVQAETTRMSPLLRSKIDGALRAMSRVESDGRITVPHPADVFVIEGKAARVLGQGLSEPGR
jgi:SAM-dependent methyltransferase